MCHEAQTLDAESAVVNYREQEPAITDPGYN